ncbi:hypothetical protein F5B20DRAFT_538584 [Whalleya microplaca]|nr:hypothetical protein F5B20DRAFT_538584 [Whalleya microplaca]
MASPIELLPIELRCQILESSPDLQSLSALALSCKSFYGCFKEYEGQITHALLKNYLGLEFDWAVSRHVTMNERLNRPTLILRERSRFTYAIARDIMRFQEVRIRTRELVKRVYGMELEPTYERIRARTVIA